MTSFKNRPPCISFCQFLASLMALSCISSVSPALAGNQVNPMIHRQSMDIVDGQGAKIKLRSVSLAPWLHWEGYLLGANLLIKQSQITDRLEQLIGKADADRLIGELRQALVTKEDIEQIAAHGFNCVRVPINYRQIDGDNAVGWALLDRLSEWCTQYHVYMVIDLHTAPGGQSLLPTADPEPKQLWQSKEKQEQTVKLWRQIATHFKGNPMVAGYDLLNEPQPDYTDNLIGLDKRMIEAIRSVDRQHMIVIEGIKLASDFEPFTKRLDDNMVYSFHMYTFFGDERARKLAQYAKIAHDQHVPMWVGEFGENKYEMIESTLKMFASSDFIVGSSFWPWKRAAGKYPSLNIIEVPPSWKALMDWVGNPFHKRPTKQEAIDAFAEFEKAASIQNTVPDTKLMDILEHN